MVRTQNNFAFAKTKCIILYWITHPTNQLGALSKREHIYTILFCVFIAIHRELARFFDDTEPDNNQGKYTFRKSKTISTYK